MVTKTKPKNDNPIEPEAQPEERLLEELKEDYPDPFLPFTEAPASVNVRFEVDGLSYQATARDLNLLNAWDNLLSLVGLLRAQGLFEPIPQQPAAQPQPQVQVVGPKMGSGAGNPFGGQPAQPQGQAEYAPKLVPGTDIAYDGVFDAANLVGSFDAEHGTNWKVKGGKYTQYGVTIWPEVLDAAVEMDTETAAVWPLQGWKAYYTNNPETGKPRKVVALVRG